MKAEVPSLFLNKGVRVRARISNVTMPSLAGMQMKVQLEVHNVIGVIRHIWAPDMTYARADIRLALDPDEGYEDVETRDEGCSCGPGHKHVLIKLDDVIETIGRPLASAEAAIVLEVP